MARHAPAPAVPIKVRAKVMVFYGEMRRRPGTVFPLERPEDLAHFAANAVEVVSEETPETVRPPMFSPTPRRAEPVVDEDNPLGAE